jgi:hypothetical protein
MPSFGDYVGYRNHYTDKTKGEFMAAGAAITVSPKSANHQLFIQKVTVAISTHANAKNVVLADSNGSPVAYGTLADKTAAAGVPDVVVFDFGPKGVPVTLGKNFTVTSDASGPAGMVTIDAYEKLGAVIAYDSGASLQ